MDLPPLDPSARTVRVILGAMAVLMAIHLVGLTAVVLKSSSYYSLETSFYLVPPELVRQRDALLPLEVLAMLGLIGAAAAWMAWQDLACTHLRGLGIDTGFEKRLGVWWWLVPGANLWLPYRIIQATAARVEETNRRGPRSGFITWWWVLWVAGSLCWLAGSILALTVSGSSTLAYARSVVRLQVAGDVCLIVAALLGVAIVGRITEGLGFAERRRRHEAAAAAAGSTTHV